MGSQRRQTRRGQVVAAWLLASSLAVCYAQSGGEASRMDQLRAKPDPLRRERIRRVTEAAPRPKIQPAVRERARSEAEVPVFILLTQQPQQEIFRAYRESAGGFDSLAARQAAFREADMVLAGPQAAMEASLLRWGAHRIGKYRTSNLMTAEVSAAALDALEADPAVASVFLVERHSAHLAISVPDLGAPAFWSLGFTGAGQSVGVLDTGVRTDHPAFAGRGIVSRTFLTYGSTSSCFNDDAASPQDLYGHGTHVAGIVMSQGSAGFAAYLGVAKGLSTLYNLKIAYREKTSAGCSGAVTSDMRDVLEALGWALANTPVRIFNYSFGSPAVSGSDDSARLLDARMDDYDALVVISAGNDGPNEYTVNSPGTAYNGITVANWTTRGVIADSSSRGPTLDDRFKPDLAAPGTNIVSTAYDWASLSFVAKSGTSMAAPHIAGAAALVASAGVTDPLAIKALLLNSTDDSGWASDSGWGSANLDFARTMRSSTATGVLDSTFRDYRFYRVPAPSNLWALLTWNAHIGGGLTPYLANLGLSVYDLASQTLLAESSAAGQNVQQVFVNSPHDVLVKAQLFGAAGGGYTEEKFGLSFSDPYTVPAGPSLVASCSFPPTILAHSTFDISCKLKNTGDLPVVNAMGSLEPPVYYSTMNSYFPFGSLEPGATSPVVTRTFTASWATGAFNLKLFSEASAFDVVFGGYQSFPLTVTYPVPTAPSNPSPADGAISVPRTGVVFSWTAAVDATSYDFWFGGATPGYGYYGNTTATSFTLPLTLDPGGTYYWHVVAHTSAGLNSSPAWSFRTVFTGASRPDKIGIYHNGTWFLDTDGTGVWSAGDKAFAWGNPTMIAVTGDWNGDGKTEIGVYDHGIWYLDADGNGVWSAGDFAFMWGLPTSIPVLGDWNGDGKTKWGVFDNGNWYLDMNGSRVWDAGDAAFGWGDAASTPVVGDWNGDGKAKAGVYKAGIWYLDANGSGVWDAGDRAYQWGDAASLPVTGDWNGDGKSKTGIVKAGIWYLDVDGSGTWTSGDKAFAWGSAVSIPVVGDWNGDGRAKAGAYAAGNWILDSNGDFLLGTEDSRIPWGNPGDTPLAGKW